MLKTLSPRSLRAHVPASQGQHAGQQVARRRFRLLQCACAFPRERPAHCTAVRSFHSSRPAFLAEHDRGSARKSAYTPRPVDTEFIASLYEYQAPNRNDAPYASTLEKVEDLLLSVKTRKVHEFQRPEGGGNLLTAVDTLLRAKRVVLCTGFNVAKGMPETDGPLGTAILARTLCNLNKNVVVVADSDNLELMRVALRELDPQSLQRIRLDVLSGSHANSGQQAELLLQSLKPDAVMNIELPGRNSDGEYLNMRGIQINEFNQPIDEIMNIANLKGIATIAVGDGGNEGGMGGVLNIPLALNDKEMQAVVPAGHHVFAWNSNLGALASAELLHGIYHDASTASLGRACTKPEIKNLIHALMRAGAVDGVTRSADPADGKSGVDGYTAEVHQRDLETLHEAIPMLRAPIDLPVHRPACSSPLDG
jgi:hypothetical protein